MTITRDVVTDLLPLYFAGEASADTRALLEEYLRENPAFATAVRAQAERSTALLAGALAPPSPDLEIATFDRVRRFNGYRHQLLAFTIAFSLIPFAFVFENRYITWLMVRDNPKQAIYFWVAAVGCAIAYRLVGRRAQR